MLSWCDASSEYPSLSLVGQNVVVGERYALQLNCDGAHPIRLYMSRCRPWGMVLYPAWHLRMLFAAILIAWSSCRPGTVDQTHCPLHEGVHPVWAQQLQQCVCSSSWVLILGTGSNNPDGLVWIRGGGTFINFNILGISYIFNINAKNMYWYWLCFIFSISMLHPRSWQYEYQDKIENIKILVKTLSISRYLAKVCFY